MCDILDESTFIARDMLDDVLRTIEEHVAAKNEEFEDDAFHSDSTIYASPQAAMTRRSHYLAPGDVTRDSGIYSSVTSISSSGWSSRSSSESHTSPESLLTHRSRPHSLTDDPDFLDGYRTPHGLVDLDRLYPCLPDDPCLLDKILMAENRRQERRHALLLKSVNLNLKRNGSMVKS